MNHLVRVSAANTWPAQILRPPSVPTHGGLLSGVWNPAYFDRQYREKLRSAAKAAGINQRIDCRVLRATFGSLMIRRRHTPYEVSKLMGNSPVVVEEHYARLLATEIDTNL